MKTPAPHALRALAILSLMLLDQQAATARDSTLNESALPESGHGVLALEVVSNSPRLSDRLENWTHLLLVDRLNTRKRVEIHGMSTGLLGTRAFAGSLQAGSYNAYSLLSFKRDGDFSYSLRAPLGRMLGQIDVIEGAVTDLGIWGYQPLGEEAETGAPVGFVLVPLTSSSGVKPMLSTRNPKLSTFAERPAQALADAAQREKSQELVDRKLRPMAQGTRFITLPDRKTVALGKLGSVASRGANGVWVVSSTGLPYELAAIAADRHGYVVAGERGVVLTGPSLEGPWMPRQGPGVDHAVIWIHSLADQSYVAVGVRDDQATVFHVDREFIDWRAKAQVVVQEKLGLSVLDMVHAYLNRDDQVILHAGSKQVFFDPVSDTHRVEEGDIVLGIAVQPDGTILKLPWRTWNGFKEPAFSTDGGRTWQLSKPSRQHEPWPPAHSPATLPVPLVIGSTKHVAVGRKYVRRGPRKRITGSDDSYLRILNPQSGEISWGTRLPDGCAQLLPTISSESDVFVLCKTGGLIRSSDLGESWTIDWPSGRDPSRFPEGASTKHTET